MGAGGHRPEHLPHVSPERRRDRGFCDLALRAHRGAEERLHPGGVPAHGPPRAAPDPHQHSAVARHLLAEQRLSLHGDRHGDEFAAEAGRQLRAQRQRLVQGQARQVLRGHAARLPRELRLHDFGRPADPARIAQVAPALCGVDQEDGRLPLRIGHPRGRPGLLPHPHAGPPHRADGTAGVPSRLHPLAVERAGRLADGGRRERAHAPHHRLLQRQACQRPHIPHRQWHGALDLRTRGSPCARLAELVRHRPLAGGACSVGAARRGPQPRCPARLRHSAADPA
mmetsp:Transcript_5777/g.15358  ORF Transcript_5777/g.15358 Transcript_5777/m.15358 type:complete len:283 (-) Transcript_5777:420-1268(-)